jgi:hypothetical protein
MIFRPDVFDLTRSSSASNQRQGMSSKDIMVGEDDDASVYPTGRVDGFEMRMFVSYGGYGDALVIAPDGRKAGLIWETGDAPSFATSIEPDSGRWGTYAVTLPMPLTTDAEADAYLAALLPRLEPLWRGNPDAGAGR